MMKLVAAMAFAAVISTPALAQYGGQGADHGAYAYQYGRAAHASNQQDWRGTRRHSPNPSYDVYDTQGHYVGSDPDPRVRDELYFDRSGRGY
jgi:hypothetical protein